MKTISISEREYKKLEKLALTFTVLSKKYLKDHKILEKAINYQARIGIRSWLSLNGMGIG